MKPVRRGQRIFFLFLLVLSVLTPLLLVSTRLKTLNSTGRKEFIEELYSFKHSTDALKLSSTELEAQEGLREPSLVLYKVGKNNSVTKSASSDQIIGSEKSISAVGSVDLFGRNGTSDDNRKNQLRLSVSKGKEPSSQSMHGQNLRSQSHNPPDIMVMQMKDQIAKARVFLQLSLPSSPSHSIKELRQRIKDVERALGEATRDSELPRSASLKMRSMDSVLVKVSNIYGDCPSIASKLRAMTNNNEERVRTQKNQVSYLVQLASRTTPKELHCLSMRLTNEYFSLDPMERNLPNQVESHDQELRHLAIFSDNVLACAVVVNSTVTSAKESGKIAFHVATDSLSLPAITMWFLLNPPREAKIRIHDMDRFEWLSSHDILGLKKHSYVDPRFISPLNHLRFYLPDIFPAVDKIVLLDHDVVVQRDLAELWGVDMKGKVIGVVETCQQTGPAFPEINMLINFSDPVIANKFDAKTCAWAFGMNVFDLHLWRRRNLTAVYRNYLQLGGERGSSWMGGSLALGWLTFYNHTFSLDRRWQALGLGHDSRLDHGYIQAAAVIHYDGLMKPWLDICVRKYKAYWNRFLNYDHSFLQDCNINQ